MTAPRAATANRRLKSWWCAQLAASLRRLGPVTTPGGVIDADTAAAWARACAAPLPAQPSPRLCGATGRSGLVWLMCHTPEHPGVATHYDRSLRQFWREP